MRRSQGQEDLRNHNTPNISPARTRANSVGEGEFVKEEKEQEPKFTAPPKPKTKLSNINIIQLKNDKCNQL